MDFVVVDHYAAAQLIENRFLQSGNYDAGMALCEALRGNTVTFPPIRGVHLARRDRGIYMLGVESREEQYLVFDLNACALFEDRSPSDILTIFQRLLRFTIKLWKGLARSSNEKIIPHSSKAVVFPYPITTQSSFRITMDRSPDAKRREKRRGEFLLVYRAGFDEGGGANEQPNLAVFRNAIVGLPDAIREAKEKGEEQNTQSPADIEALRVYELGEKERPDIHEAIGYDNWLRMLTDEQRKFVEKVPSGPERIEGPAGTGKTLCLVLKSINQIEEAKRNFKECHILFVTHSIPTKNNINEIFEHNSGHEYIKADRTDSMLSIKVTTLQEWCIEQLGAGLAETEYLDRDAMESKKTQILYVSEAVDEVLNRSLATYSPMLSEQFREFIESENRWALAEMMQHEIAVEIKGRASEDLDKYKKTRSVKYNLPIFADADFGLVFEIFNSYQRRLSEISQFDSDDIILSAMGQLDTPIWRRRRAREGFGSVYVDETHLFNVNELSVFHHLTDSPSNNCFVFSRDTSQAVGDRGVEEEGVAYDGNAWEESRFNAIFRCTSPIVELAFHVTASGASLYYQLRESTAKRYADNDG